MFPVALTPIQLVRHCWSDPMEHPEPLCPLRASLLRPPGCRVRVKWQSVCRVPARGQVRRGVPRLFVSFQSLQKQEGIFSTLIARGNHLGSFHPHCPDHTLQQLNQNFWGWGPGLSTFQAPQVVTMCTQGREPLLYGRRSIGLAAFATCQCLAD